MNIVMRRFSTLLAAAGSVAIAASFATSANAAGDPASVQSKYQSTYYAPYVGAPHVGPGVTNDGVRPYAQPGINPQAAAPNDYDAYRDYDPNANLGQGSGMGPAMGR